MQTLIKEHSEYVFYVNSAMDYEGALAFARSTNYCSLYGVCHEIFQVISQIQTFRFDDGAVVPKFYFFRDGLGLFFPGQVLTPTFMLWR